MWCQGSRRVGHGGNPSRSRSRSCDYVGLTERSEYSKHSQQEEHCRGNGSSQRNLRRRDRHGSRDIRDSDPAPGSHLCPAVPTAAPRRARRHCGRARTEQEQHLRQHPRPGRMASGPPRTRRRLAQGPLRGGHRLLAPDAGDAGAPLSLQRAPGPGRGRREHARRRRRSASARRCRTGAGGIHRRAPAGLRGFFSVLDAGIAAFTQGTPLSPETLQKAPLRAIPGSRHAHKENESWRGRSDGC